jgi:membrane-bound serine protease (ClpP class)
MWFILGLLLIVLAAVLLVVEIFVPSFGLLAICAITSLVAGIWLFFKVSTAAGWIGVGIAAVVVPIVWIVTYRLFPKTSFGKSVTLEGPERDLGDAIPDTQDLAKMLGETGIVITPLRPVGMCDFDGQRFECVAERGYVDKEEKILVIHVEGTQLTVRLNEYK